MHPTQNLVVGTDVNGKCIESIVVKALVKGDNSLIEKSEQFHYATIDKPYDNVLFNKPSLSHLFWTEIRSKS